MNNYYNNNQRPYGNQYQPNQNIYQQANYMPPSRNMGGNIYGQVNYNQNNQNIQNQNLNQNQNNNGPKVFISGYIGRLKISAEDLETFSKSLKSAEWTTNTNYLQAKNIDIKVKLSLKGQSTSDISIPKNRFNDYNINSVFKYDEYQNFIKNAEEQNKKKKEEGEKERNEFLRVNFPSENPDISNDELYKKIKEKKNDIIKNDSKLYGKVEKLLPLLNSGDAPNPSHDFAKHNSDGKIMSGGSLDAPGVAY